MAEVPGWRLVGGVWRVGAVGGCPAARSGQQDGVGLLTRGGCHSPAARGPSTYHSFREFLPPARRGGAAGP